MPGQEFQLGQEQRMQQVLAPRMLQSLEMLQAPVLELRELIQKELLQNPVLEEGVDPSPRVELEAGSGQEEPAEPMDFDKEREFEVFGRLEEEWEEHLQPETAPYTKEDASRRGFLIDSITRSPNLQDHLLQQLEEEEVVAAERPAMEWIIGSINEDGYLTTSLEDLAAATGMAPAQLAGALARVQDFDPAGVGARDLRECLLLQLRRQGKHDGLEARLVAAHLDDLAAHRYGVIARALSVEEEAVRAGGRFIATLEPKPGRAFWGDDATYIAPEADVHQDADGRWTVSLNNEQLPRVRIRAEYRQMLADARTSAEACKYLREKIRDGEFLMQSIHNRQQTILRIAQEIVRAQTDFFEHGVSRLRPMTMAQVARAVGVHETTVSRAIANKYMRTPHGLFEMKYFFTSGYRTAGGETVSNRTVQDVIRRLVEEEDAAQPLSDQALAKRLKERGYPVARRTVAKYREGLKILPSHLRRQGG